MRDKKIDTAWKVSFSTVKLIHIKQCKASKFIYLCLKSCFVYFERFYSYAPSSGLVIISGSVLLVKKMQKLNYVFYCVMAGPRMSDFSFCARRNGKHYQLYYCDLCVVMAMATHSLYMTNSAHSLGFR